MRHDRFRLWSHLKPAIASEAVPAGGRILGALGITQIFAWGTSYYLLTVLAAPIANDTGWPLTLIVGGFSLGLLISGLASPTVGRLILLRGGRNVLAMGAVIMAAGLTLLAIAPNLQVFILGWAVIGIAMSASLYDPAFSTLGSIYGMAARRPITTLTLFGGFASTVCWPLSAWLQETIGWRGTCLAYAAIQIAISLPLLLTALPKTCIGSHLSATDPAVPRRHTPLSPDRRRTFLLLTSALVLAAIIQTVLSVHLIALLKSRGIGLAVAVSFGMFVGPAQVGGRLFEMAFGRRYHPIWTLAAASTLIAGGVILLFIGFPIPALALIVYGAGNGIWTIARGALPLALFGEHDYPVLMGKLAMPSLIAQATAPTAGALLLDTWGAGSVFALIAILAVINVGVVITLLWSKPADAQSSFRPAGKSRA